MSLAEAPSPSPSSSSGSDDFAALLDSELELISGADSAFPGDPSSASPDTDDEGEDEDEESEEVEVEVLEENGCGKPQDEEDVSGVAFGYIHKVWQKHKENLILMERYHYFASSCRQFGFGVKSLSESMQDERESDGALATVLNVLKRIHAIFFDTAVETNLSSRDVRQVIKKVRKYVLQGCKLVFSRVFPNTTRPHEQMIWKMAEHLGAICSKEVDSTVTHVVSVDLGTEKARWAVDNKKFLVHPRWIEAANFRWERQPEEDFPVTPLKEKSRDKTNAVAGQKETSKYKEENAVVGQKETSNYKKEENAVAGQKEMSNDPEGNDVAGQEEDDSKENVVASTSTSSTDPAES
nr:unnamed protein product [Digitaria exilis]